jgi:hypothetical protein
MTRIHYNPLLNAVKAVVKFPTVEDMLCEGRVVNFYMLREVLGNRLVIENRKLCMSHVKSLASSIMELRAVVIPLTVERNGNDYILTDGYHRLAALDMINKIHPDIHISINIIKMNE